MGEDAPIIAAAIVTVLIVLIPGIVSIIGAKAAAEDRAEAKAARVLAAEAAALAFEKADKIMGTTAKIEGLADGQLSKVTAALAVANETIFGQEKQISLLTESKQAEAVLNAAATPPGSLGSVTLPGETKP